MIDAPGAQARRFHRHPRRPGRARAIWRNPALPCGAAIELVFSFLVGAVTTLCTTVFMIGLLFRKKITWSGQARDAHALEWRTALRSLWPQTVFGLALIGALGADLAGHAPVLAAADDRLRRRNSVRGLDVPACAGRMDVAERALRACRRSTRPIAEIDRAKGTATRARCAAVVEIQDT